MANDAIARKHPMNDMKKITDYEIAVERRLEKACERDGWVVSAHVSFGADYVDCQLEKFGREEVCDEGNDFNLNDGEYRANDWGRPKPSGYPENELMPWLHSDIKNMAYYYVYPAFTNIVEKGELR